MVRFSASESIPCQAENLSTHLGVTPLASDRHSSCCMGRDVRLHDEISVNLGWKY